jgi:hypothetical protein
VASEDNTSPPFVALSFPLCEAVSFPVMNIDGGALKLLRKYSAGPFAGA